MSRRAGNASAAVVLTLAVTGLGGCTDSPEPPPEPGATATTTLPGGESPAPDVAPTVAEILEAYEGFRQAEIDAYADPGDATGNRELLEPYVASPMLDVMTSSLDRIHQLGVVRQGTPRADATVLELRHDGSPPSALVRECLDASGWEYVDAADDAAPDAVLDNLRGAYPDRYVRFLHAVRYQDGWRLDDSAVLRSWQC